MGAGGENSQDGTKWYVTTSPLILIYPIDLCTLCRNYEVSSLTNLVHSNTGTTCWGFQGTKTIFIARACWRRALTISLQGLPFYLFSLVAYRFYFEAFGEPLIFFLDEDKKILLVENDARYLTSGGGFS